MDKEYILCAAIHYNDNTAHVHQPKNIKLGFVIAGRRHHNCFTTVSILRDGKPYSGITKIQGFITNTDRFVDRVEGYKIAKEAKQLLNELNEAPSLVGLNELSKAQALLSEDVW